MAETLYGHCSQLYAVHDRDEFHVESGEQVFGPDIEPPRKRGAKGPTAFLQGPPVETWDRGYLVELVRDLLREPRNREAFGRAMHCDPELRGLAPSTEAFGALVVRRVATGQLVLVPYVPNKDVSGGADSGILDKVEPPKPKPPPAREKHCKLVHADLECSHDVKGKPRKPKNGELCVVPAEAGDVIKLEGDWEDGCGQHPTWTIQGFWTGTEKKAKASFKARPWFVGSPGATMILRWLSGVAPKTYTVNAEGCAGSKKFTIKSYPADKLTVTVAGEKWEALQERIDHFIKHTIGKVLKDPRFEILKGKASVSAQWTEWTDHTAYYKWEAAVGFNPLIGAKIRVPFGPLAAIPRWMKDLTATEAGFFVEFAGGININGKWSRATPQKPKMFAEAQGYVYGKIGAELKLMSKKVMAVEVSGRSGFGMTAAPDYKVEKPTLLIELKWEGVKGLVTATAAYGWIEIEHEFNLVDEKTIWEKQPFALVKEG